MSFSDWSNKKKKKEEEEKAAKQPTKKQTFSEWSNEKHGVEDIGPVLTKKDEEERIAPVGFGNTRTSGEFGGDKEERKWFQKGAFEDGYQFGDVSKTILGSIADVGENLGSGVIGMGEKVVDALAYLAPAFNAGQQAQNNPYYQFDIKQYRKEQEQSKEFIAKDLYNEEEIAKKIISNPVEKVTGVSADFDSVFGEKSDALVQSAGQLGATIGLQAVGVPWFITTGATSFGGEVESALNQGASYEAAGASAAITAGAEILTEKLSGGISFGGKALDDVLVKELSRSISNKTLRTMAKLGLDALGEGSEEIISQVFSNLGSSLYKEESIEELLFNEEAMDEYLESFIGGAVLGGGMGGINAIKSGKHGVDYASGLTANEQKVVEKVYQDRVAEQEKTGKLTEKQKSKIYDEILNDMEKGYISTDTIEEVLGGETYKSYKDTIDSEDALAKEFEELGNKQNATLAEQSRYAELKQQMEDIKKNSKRDQFKTQLGEEVFGLVQSDKLLESYNERGRKGQAFEADLSQYDTKYHGTIQKAIDSGILNNTNRTHEFVDMIAKISADKGVLFDFTNNARLKESGFAVDGKSVNGYITKDGVTLNIDSSKSMNSVVGHEITHVLEGTELYTELQTALFEYAKAKKDYQGRYDTLSKLYEGVDGANVDAELTADLVGDYLFTDADFINNLSTNHRNVFQKIYDEIKYLCKVATAGSKEARELEKVKKAFEEAYRGEGKTQDGTKYSVSDKNIKDVSTGYASGETYFTMSYMKDGKVVGTVEYGEYAGEPNVKMIEVNPEYRRQGIGKKLLQELQKKYPDTEIDFGMSTPDGTKLLDAVTYTQTDEQIADGKRRLAASQSELSEVERRLNELYDLSELTAEQEREVQQLGERWDQLYYTDIRNLTEEYGGKSDTRRLVKLDDTKYSLSDSEGVKLSQEQQEYFKNSVVRDENGNLKRMYHGTSKGGFTVFDTYGSNHGLFGQGSYFTDDAEVGLSYTEKGKGKNPDLYEVYLNITNPMDMDAAADVNAWRKAFPDADFPDSGTNEQFYRAMERYFEDEMYEKWEAASYAVEAIQGMGYDGITHVGGGRFNKGDTNRHQVYIAFEPEQIKSFNNTKPTSNPDIRYSLSDSEGRHLSEGQSEYFKDSKVRDENGSLKVMYHGTPNGDFTVFKDGTYFTDNKEYADRYQSPSASSISSGKVVSNPKTFEVYLDIKKPFDITDAEARRIYIEEYIKGGNALGINPYLSDAEYDKISTIDWTEGEDLRDFLIENGYDYDGLVLDEGADGGYGDDVQSRGTSYVVFSPEQVKNIDNQNPTSNPDIHRSLSNKGEATVRYGTYNVPGKDIALEAAPDIAPVVTNKLDSLGEQRNQILDRATALDHKKGKTEEEVFEMERLYKQGDELMREIEAEVNRTSPADLAEIAKQARRENFRGAYTYNGKQYLSDGSFIAEFNTVDESLGQSKEFPAKRALKELDDAYERQIPGNYNLHTADNGYVKVGDFLYDTKYVNALIRAIESPVFTLSNVRGGDNALLVSGENGRALLMPVRAGDNVKVAYEAQPVAEGATDIFPDDLAPMPEDSTERLESLTDADAPPEAERYNQHQAVEAEDPFQARDIDEVGERKVKAYMYENPEVKPFFQEEAAIMLAELQNSEKGERWFISGDFDGIGAESYYRFGGQKRTTSEDIAYLLDGGWKYNGKGYSYDEIEKGLNAIIEDNGAENNACSKRIEFLLNDRLLYGYKDFFTGQKNHGNPEYANLLKEKNINEYSKESFDAFMANADQYAPVEDIGPVAEEVAPIIEKPVKEAYEAIRPKPQKEPRMARATPEEQARAQVLTEEPEAPKKKSGAWSMFKDNFVDKGTVFETMSLKTGNRELQGRWKAIGRAESSAQWFMEHGNASTNSLKSIRDTVEQSGKTQEFYEYLYHLHNADRMTLADRYEDVENKPVFGYGVTAKESADTAAKLEGANPEFKQYAQEVYDYMGNLREMLVDGGVISDETAKLWAEMYPHYVPIRRVGDEGLNINVALDTKRTGVNAPIKRATGGNRDILPLFDTMAMRTEQTFKAIARNRFGVELKNMLGTTIDNEAVGVDEAIDSVDTQDGLLQEGKDGRNPTFTVFENGEKVTFEITDEMYDTMKPKSRGMGYTNKVLNKANNIRRGLLTEYNPAFMLTNPIKDTQDILVNSQHPARTYANIPKAISELWNKNGQYYQEYMEHGGEQNTYFDGEAKTFVKEKNGLSKAIGFPLEKISQANNFIERVPRMAEYIASRKMGRSVDVAMLDAARVTTDFSAGGDLVKLANRNGFTFLNASVQGAVQQVRNIREAKHNGLKGWAQLTGKIVAAGLPAMLVNHLLWDDDEEYAELSDYVKQNYYIVGKYGDGKFVRIPKGRALAVIQSAFEQMENIATGNDEVDLKAFGELVVSNLAPNNPLDNNLIAPISQAFRNETWYGEDLVPTRLQDLPAAEQYDETTDSISKWLGERTNSSPYKWNYLLDQYSGAVGDMFLPMLTPEAERGNNTLLAPVLDKFTTDSVMKNQNVSDFYDTKDELAVNAKASGATDEDVLMSKYMNSINDELYELYAEKRKIQSSDLSDSEKYEAVRDIQSQIVALTREGLNTYEDISYEDDVAIIGDRYFKKNDEGEWEKMSDKQVTKYDVTSAAGDAPYASDGTNHYYWHEPGEDSDAEPGWRKLTDEQFEKQEEVTKSLGISPEEYWGNKDEYDYAYKYPENYAVSKAVGGYDAYKTYSSELYDIKADKDANGKSISGSRKEKVYDYINGLDIDYGEKIILFKNEYNADDTYNYEIIDYLNGRDDISYEEMETILKKIGFTVSSDGTISW